MNISITPNDVNSSKSFKGQHYYFPLFNIEIDVYSFTVCNHLRTNIIISLCLTLKLMCTVLQSANEIVEVSFREAQHVGNISSYKMPTRSHQKILRIEVLSQNEILSYILKLSLFIESNNYDKQNVATMFSFGIQDKIIKS